MHYQKVNNLTIDGKSGPKTMKNVAINIAKELIHHEVDRSIKSDSNIEKSYGWDVKEVDNFTYFVAYEFDYDFSRDNGWMSYAYEVDLVKKTATAILGELELERKYRKLGFIN